MVLFLLADIFLTGDLLRFIGDFDLLRSGDLLIGDLLRRDLFFRRLDGVFLGLRALLGRREIFSLSSALNIDKFALLLFRSGFTDAFTSAKLSLISSIDRRKLSISLINTLDTLSSGL